MKLGELDLSRNLRFRRVTPYLTQFEESRGSLKCIRSLSVSVSRAALGNY